MIVPVIMLFVFFIVLSVSIMFSSAEIAIGNISRDSLERLSENNIRGASMIMGIISNKRRFQLMLMSGRTISVVGGTVVLYVLCLNYALLKNITTHVILLLAFAVSSVSFVLADTLLARFAAMGEHEKTVTRFAYFIVVFHILLYPLTFIIEKILSVVIKENIELAAKEEALIEYVKSESESGVIEEEEKEMIESVLEFSDTTVREVMVPRIDMIAAKNDITIDELITLFEHEGHSRIPVYDGRVDNIIGVIYAKDLLTVVAQKGKENFAIDRIMRKAYFVPETKKISILLEEFRKEKVHIAIVVDEYGGTAGIVALEDLLEEIVGEIHDEYDEEESESLWINDSTVIIDPGLDIHDVNEMIHATIPNEDFDTLSGFLYHQLGFIPQGGEVVEWENITFIIKEIDGNRISKVLVKLNEASSPDEK